jgi:hypothetical protein
MKQHINYLSRSLKFLKLSKQTAVKKEKYAEVVTFVAGSLEAGGLPGSLEVLVVLK